MKSSEPATARATLWCLAAIVAIAGFLRLEATSGTVVDHPVRADAAEYLAYAYNTLNRGVYSRRFSPETPPPDAVRSPGYPLFLLPFSADLPSERSVYLITLAQALLGTLTVLLSFVLYRGSLAAGPALAATLLTALSPHLVSAGTYVLTETLFCLLLVAIACVSSRVTARSSVAGPLALGLLLGAATLVRPSAQYFLPLLAGLILLQFGRRPGLRMAAIVTLGFALALAPWIARNLAVLGQWSDPRLTINFLHHGMYPDFTYRDLPQSFGFPYRFDPDSASIGASTSSALLEIARRFVEEPVRHLHWFLIGKPLAFLGWDIVNGYGDVFVYPTIESPYLSEPLFTASHALMRSLHGALMVLAVLGALLVWLPGDSSRGSGSMTARLCSALVLYFIAIHVVGAPFPRYAVPLRPIMFGLAVFAAVHLARATAATLANATARGTDAA